MTIIQPDWATHAFGDLTRRHDWRISDRGGSGDEKNPTMVCAECGSASFASEIRYIANNCIPHIPAQRGEMVLTQRQAKRLRR